MDKARIFALTMTIALMSVPANAWLRAKDPHVDKSPFRDDASKCSPQVRGALAKALGNTAWGKFHFECWGATVMKMRAPQKSPIFRNWAKFIIENAELFDIDPATVRVDSKRGPLAVYQLVFGVRMRDWKRYRAEGDDLVISTDFLKTKDWNFQRKLSSADAVRIAEREWKKAKEPKPIPKNVKLDIIIEQRPCTTCPGNGLYWNVESDAQGSECLVNAETGAICKPCSSIPQGCSF